MKTDYAPLFVTLGGAVVPRLRKVDLQPQLIIPALFSVETD